MAAGPVRQRAILVGAMQAAQSTRSRFAAASAVANLISGDDEGKEGTGGGGSAPGSVTAQNRRRVRMLADSVAARLGEQKDYAYIDDSDVCEGPQGAFMRPAMDAMARLR